MSRKVCSKPPKPASLETPDSPLAPSPTPVSPSSKPASGSKPLAAAKLPTAALADAVEDVGTAIELDSNEDDTEVPPVAPPEIDESANVEDLDLQEEDLDTPFIELLVFKDNKNSSGSPPAPGQCQLLGALVLRPTHTINSLRHLVAEEMQLPEELVLSKARLQDGDSVPQPARVPIPKLQNFKLAYPMFTRPGDVLVVQQRVLEPTPELRQAELLSNAMPGEKMQCPDISDGAERIPIPCYNGVDNEPPPVDFTYVIACIINESERLVVGGPLRMSSCACEGPCDPSRGCACLQDAGPAGHCDHTPYDAKGRLIEARESVYECTLLCRCPPTCPGRVVQHGLQFRFEVFRCLQAKGWGVRSRDFIPKGRFVCEYIGELISDDEAEIRGVKYDDARMSRLMDIIGDGSDSVRMCIDATLYSNLGRFFNHSCDPNMIKQRVFADHNTRLPRIALFAMRDIEPLEELCYNYGYAEVPGKTLPCYCGAQNCSGMLY